mgnify:CR=1 FL=1
MFWKEILVLFEYEEVVKLYNKGPVIIYTQGWADGRVAKKKIMTERIGQ